MGMWGKTREEREREYHEVMARLDAAAAEREGDDEGVVRYTLRLWLEDLALMLCALAVCAVGAGIGAALGGTTGLVLGLLAGLLVCGIVYLTALAWGVGALVRRWRRRRRTG